MSSIENLTSQSAIVSEPYKEMNIKNTYEHPISFQQISEISHLDHMQETEHYSSDLSSSSNVSSSDSDSDSDFVLKASETEKVACSPAVEKHLINFYNYLTGPDRGRKARSNIKVVQDVRRIFVAVGAVYTISNIFKDPKKYLRDNYLMSYCINRRTKAISIRKYLYSFMDFCKYLFAENIKIENVESEEINRVQLKVEAWRKSYLPVEKLHKQKTKETNFEMLITPDQVELYHSHEHAKKAIALFKELNSNSALPITQTSYCCMRDHLYIVIAFGNAHRSGVVANMKMNEYLKAKKLTDDLWEISVWDHKTVEVYGPAKVTLLNYQFDWLKIFVNSARSKLVVQDDNLFLSWSGKRMASGDISARLHHLWCKAGIIGKNIQRRLCFNDVRRTASTLVRESNSNFTQEVADTMMHSSKTAEEHYYIRQKEKSVKVGGQVLREHFFPAHTLSTPKKKWSKDEISVLKQFESINGLVTLPNIKSNITELSSVNASPKQIYDKFRSIQRYNSSNVLKESSADTKVC